MFYKRIQDYIVLLRLYYIIYNKNSGNLFVELLFPGHVWLKMVTIKRYLIKLVKIIIAHAS